MRRGTAAPTDEALVVRGGSHEGLVHEELVAAAELNHQLYGFHGISAWLVGGEWSLARIAKDKLGAASRLILFRAGHLRAQDLELWDTGQAPHLDIVLPNGESGDLADRVMSAEHHVMAQLRQGRRLT
jgi:hypothetical protein